MVAFMPISVTFDIFDSSIESIQATRRPIINQTAAASYHRFHH